MSRDYEDASQDMAGLMASRGPEPKKKKKPKAKSLPVPVCNHDKITIKVWMPNCRSPVSILYCAECEAGYSKRYILLDLEKRGGKAGK